jgi:hypothetical protein
MNRPDVVKKLWAEPKLIVHGTVEHITQGGTKTLGPTDGNWLMGDPIQTVGS